MNYMHFNCVQCDFAAGYYTRKSPLIFLVSKMITHFNKPIQQPCTTRHTILLQTVNFKNYSQRGLFPSSSLRLKLKPLS